MCAVAGFIRHFFDESNDYKYGGPRGEAFRASLLWIHNAGKTIKLAVKILSQFSALTAQSR